MVHDDDGIPYRGKKLILASGSVDILPDIPGFEDLWGDTMYVFLPFYLLILYFFHPFF
jgi:thioredoxin reductase